MSALHDALSGYLTMRRALGTQLMWPESSLRKFVDFVEAEGAEFLTTELAMRWAVQSVGVQRATHARRLAIVRGFAAWLQATDARTQVPPQRLLPAKQRRPEPHRDRHLLFPTLTVPRTKIVPGEPGGAGKASTRALNGPEVPAAGRIRQERVGRADRALADGKIGQASAMR